MAETKKRCAILPYMKMEAEWKGKDIKVDGTMCIKKKLLAALLSKMLPDPTVAERVMEMLKEMPGDTMYFDMAFSVKTGSE
jgi:hypothetical protein